MKTAFHIFMAICWVHFAEHVAQAIQVYALGWPLHESRGILGWMYQWLVHKEGLHFAYAAVMLFGLWFFSGMFSGCARWWWGLAYGIQCWHAFEHSLLFGQAMSGHNFFGAPQPISIIQFLGFFNGSAETGFGGLLKMSHFGTCTCQGAAPGTVHTFTPLLIFVRRVEVHLLYNVAVLAPMMMALFRRRNESKRNLGPQPAVAHFA